MMLKYRMPSGVFKVEKGVLERDEFAERSAKISAEYKKKESKPEKPSVGPTQSMRERILRLSLFPNPYNHKMVYTEE